MKKRIIQCLLFCALLSSCTMAPRVANHPYYVQPKIESVAQWQDIAKTVVDLQIIPAIQNSPIRQVYIETPDCNDFARAFNDYVITDVVSNGYQIAQSPENALTFKWGAQIIGNDKTPWFPGVIMGTLEVIGFTLVGSPVMLPPNTVEMILTTQVNFDQSIFSRMSNNYYMPDSAKWNFHIPAEKKLLDPEYMKFAQIDYSHYVPYESRREIITNGVARIYDKAGVSDVLYVSQAGSVLSAIGEKKKWYLVQVNSQSSGWVSKTSVMVQ